MSDSLQPHGLEHPRLPRPTLSSGVCSNSCPLSQWCYLTISCSAATFSSCLQSFPASGPFPVSQLFVSGDQRFQASASVPVLPMNIQNWFPLEITGLISLQAKGLSGIFSPEPQFKNINSLALSFLYGQILTSIHDYCKNHNFDYMNLCQ